MTEQNTTNPKAEIEVDFGNVSIGQETARIGVEIDRSKMSLGDADKFLSGSRLKVHLLATPKGELKGQKHFDDMTETIEGEVDCKSFSVSADKFRTGFKFAAAALNLLTFVGFCKRPGKAFIEWIGDAADHDDNDEGFDPDEREFQAGADRPVGQPALKAAAAARKGLAGSDDDPAKDHPINTLSKKGLKKLAEKMSATDQYDGEGIADGRLEGIKEFLSVKTVTELENVVNSDPFWHQKIHRFGEEAIDQTSDAILFFRRMVGYPSDDSTAETEGDQATPPGYMDANIPDDEAYTLGANACVASSDASNPFPPGTRAAEFWDKGFNETEAAVGDADEDGSMLSGEHTEDVEVDQESEAVETE
jgi:hypothetical protein